MINILWLHDSNTSGTNPAEDAIPGIPAGPDGFRFCWGLSIM